MIESVEWQAMIFDPTASDYAFNHRQYLLFSQVAQEVLAELRIQVPFRGASNAIVPSPSFDNSWCSVLFTMFPQARDSLGDLQFLTLPAGLFSATARVIEQLLSSESGPHDDIDTSGVSNEAPVALGDVERYWKTPSKKTILNRMSQVRKSAPAPEPVAEKGNGEKIWGYSDLVPWLTSQWPSKGLPEESEAFSNELRKLRTD